MNIIFLTRRFYPDIGGVEKHVLEVGASLMKRGHSVTVITETTKGESEVGGIKVRRLKASDNWFKKIVIWRWMLANIGLFVNADIVHAHDVYYWYFPLRVVLPWKKSFVTFHGYESYPIRKGEIFIRRVSGKLATGSIAVGDYISKWYGTKADFVTYGGVRSTPVTGKADERSAAYVGRLFPDAGVDTYLEALLLIRKTYPDFNLTVVGDGTLRAKARKLANWVGLEENVFLYLKSSRFVFTSGYLSMMEAMISKKLVFATYSNPLKKDYLKKSPFSEYISITKTPEELAKEVVYYLSHKDKEIEKVESAYGWVKDKTWDKVTNTYLKLWDK